MNRRTNLKTFLLISVFLLATGVTATGKIIFVDANAPGPTHDGSSWANAYKYLQDSLADANSGDEIWVAQGIYKPDEGVGITPGDRTATFQLKNGVTIKGGYAGFGEADPNARDIELYETILSGDLNGDDIDVNDPCDLWDEPTRAENSRHVVTGSETDATAALEGFTITAGNDDEVDPDMGGPWGNGGGMYNCNGSPTLTNCTFSENSANFIGGGMRNVGSSPTITNCTFSGNSTKYYGGGMCNNSGSPTVTNCTFSGNSAGDGGGMYNNYSSLTLVNCEFVGNLAKYGGGMSRGGGIYNFRKLQTLTNCIFRGNSANYGGGIYNSRNSPTFINCTFGGNSAEDNGGAMYSKFNNPVLTNCLFNGNLANSGGGMYNWDSSPTLTSSTFAGNSGTNGNALACDSPSQLYPNTVQLANCILWDGGGEIWNNDGSNIEISFSDVQGGWPGESNIDADPCFVEPGYWVDANDPNIVVEPNDPNAVWIDGDYHLQSTAGRWDPNQNNWVYDANTSPCIDAGNPGCPLGDEPNDPNNIRINMGAYGGTAEASKSPANWRSIADITNDWTVDFNDLKVFVKYWLETGQCIPSDLNRSQFVDFSDFAIFGQQWSDTSAIEPSITYQVEDCNMEAGQSWPADVESGETRFSVWVEGSYIHFEDLITANCCADEIELLMTVEDNLITIYEIEHLTMACPCICDFPVTATLGPFEEGNYLVEVVDVNGYSLGIVEVTIGGPSITYQIEDCDPATSGLFAAEEADQTRFTAVVEGRYIHFEDMMTANCCPDELGLEMTVEDNLITIYETEYTPGGCLCICAYPVRATLGPFESGTYILDVYEDWGGFIGSTVVTIGLAE